MDIPCKSIWRYVGDNGPRGLLHCVLEARGCKVLTWSAPLDGEKAGGFSFWGPIADFLKEFEPIIFKS